MSFPHIQESNTFSKRELILETLEQLVQSRRFHEITLDSIAQAANIGKGTIYRYFHNKEDLFLQLAIYGFEKLYLVIQQNIQCNPKLNWKEKLHILAQVLSDFIKKHHPLMRIIHEEELRRSQPFLCSETFHSYRKKILSIIAEIFFQGQKEGTIVSSIPSLHLAILFHGLLMSRHIHSIHHKEEVPLSTLLTCFFHGILVSSNSDITHSKEETLS